MCASAEDVPLPDERFGIVLCDYGATSFTDPYRTIPEATRLLRGDGLLAFSGLTPLAGMGSHASETTPPRGRRMPA
ncbi:MAG: methyltransferase domain-containing protein [Solirubrobacteraceae bacterium]